MNNEGSNFNLSLWAMKFAPIVSIYEKYWRPAITFPFSDYQWEKKTILDMLELQNGNNILDIACGTGNFTRLFATHNKNAAITGIDISMPMLERALRQSAPYPSVCFIRADVLNLPFAAQSFDRIHCSGALHLFPEIHNVFRAIALTLKPGGIFAGSTYIKKSFIGKKLKNMFEPLLKFHWFELWELQRHASNAGLCNWKHHIRKQGIVFSVTKPLK